MSEYIKEVHSIGLYMSSGTLKGSVSLWDLSRANESRESRIETVTTVASASFGHESCKSPEALYEKLFRENNTCLEFVRTAPNYSIATSLRNDIECDYDDLTTQEDWYKKCACVKIRAPLMVIAHLVRHRSFSFNQISRRYVVAKNDDIFIPDDINNSIYGPEVQRHIEQSFKLYMELCSAGFKKEEARLVLPAYAIMTDLWMIGDMKAWNHLFSIRLSKDEKVQNWTKSLVEVIHELISHQLGKV